mgnify:CR=1 FL=1
MEKRTVTVNLSAILMLIIWLLTIFGKIHVVEDVFYAGVWFFLACMIDRSD